MKPFPHYYKRELCCMQVRYLKRFSETKADDITTTDGVITRQSVATYANDQEFMDRLGGYVEIEGEEVELLIR